LLKKICPAEMQNFCQPCRFHSPQDQKFLGLA